jgi:hypothetical protein
MKTVPLHGCTVAPSRRPPSCRSYALAPNELGEHGSRSNISPSASKISGGVYQSSVAPMHGSCSAMPTSDAALPIGALVAGFQLIKHRWVLRVEEPQRRAATWQRPQQRKRVAGLSDIALELTTLNPYVFKRHFPFPLPSLMRSPTGFVAHSCGMLELRMR